MLHRWELVHRGEMSLLTTKIHFIWSITSIFQFIIKVWFKMEDGSKHQAIADEDLIDQGSSEE